MTHFACSGPRAGQLIAENIEYAERLAWIAAGCFVASILLALVLTPGRRPFLCATALLLALHPAWTISAIRGDCGYLKAGTATIVTVIAPLVVIAQGAVGLALRSRALHGPAVIDDW